MQQNKEILKEFFFAGLKAVAPDSAIRTHLRLEKNNDAPILWIKDQAYPLQGKKVLLLGAGKGVAPMAQAIENLFIEENLENYLTEGLVVVKYDHGLPLKFTKLLEAAHPVPDENGVLAASALLEKARNATQEHLVICLFTGGASALTPAPTQSISLEDVQTTTSALLACAASIQEINAIRKHLSAFSGGQLALIAQPAKVIGLMISDVIGDELDVIASGPTVPDASTFNDCLAILKKYNISTPPAVEKRLHQGAQGHIPETPKASDAFFANVHNELMATNEDALDAMAEYAENFSCSAAPQGFEPYVLDVPMQGEAKDMAIELVRMAKEMQAALCPNNTPLCLMAGGETTVNIQGTGKGGRNQEMALAAALALESHENIYALFAGTDGTDGPTDAAGGFAHSLSSQNMRAHVNPQEMLNNNDSYNALSASNDIFITGPTRTNVMDVALFLVYPR